MTPNRKDVLVEAILVTLMVIAILALAAQGRAQNHRASDMVYLPVAGSVGAFRTDVTLTNFSADPVAITVRFSPANTPNPVAPIFPNVVHLAARERREIADFVSTQLHQSGVGMLIFAACRELADCSVLDTSPNARNYRLIGVESRTYATGPTGTIGQDVPGIAWDATAQPSDALQIVGIRTGAAWRTNIGLANGAEWSSSTLTVVLHNGTGGVIDSRNFTLGPLENFQMAATEMFPVLANGSRLNRGVIISSPWISVTQSGVTPTADAAANGCPAGCPAFTAYGSMLDGGTSDATTLEAVYMPPEAPVTAINLTELSAMPDGDRLRLSEHLRNQAGATMRLDSPSIGGVPCKFVPACVAGVIERGGAQ